jgi:hypothetical protein
MIMPTMHDNLEGLPIKSKKTLWLFRTLIEFGPMLTSEAKRLIGKTNLELLLESKHLVLRHTNIGDCVVAHGIKHPSNIFGRGEKTLQHLLKTQTLEHLLIMRDGLEKFSSPGASVQIMNWTLAIITAESKITWLVVANHGVTTETLRRKIYRFAPPKPDQIEVVTCVPRKQKYRDIGVPVRHHHWKQGKIS